MLRKHCQCFRRDYTVVNVLNQDWTVTEIKFPSSLLIVRSGQRGNAAMDVQEEEPNTNMGPVLQDVILAKTLLNPTNPTYEILEIAIGQRCELRSENH